MKKLFSIPFKKATIKAQCLMVAYNDVVPDLAFGIINFLT